LRVRKLPGNVCEIEVFELGSLQGSASKISGISEKAEFFYTWHDFSKISRGGRGHAVSGRFIEAITPGRPTIDKPRSPKSYFPFCAYNRTTISIANYMYQALNVRWARSRESLGRAFFPVQGLQQYFRFFGPRGFHSCQVILPVASFEAYARETIKRSQAHGIAITLASTKVFAGPNDLLRFSGDGICLSIDVPRTGRSELFLKELDGLTISIHGRPNIIKDSRLSPTVVEALFPEYDRFRALLKSWDPNRLFQSELSRRLAL
jgi:decaprenylphospho-beta-D-ribofuranose 2-oxidase